MQERRKFKRLESSSNVKHRVKGAKTEEYSLTNDISAGGVRIGAIKDMKVGAHIDLELHIPNNVRPFYAVGEVVWVKKSQTDKKNKFDIGIKFVKIVPREELEGF